MFHGIRTAKDFVEAPSQMLEYWTWLPSQLKSLSKHYSYLSPEYEQAWRETVKGNGTTAGNITATRPPETLPDDLIETLIKSRRVNGALGALSQLHFGIFDMTIHTPQTHKQLEDLRIAETYNRLLKEVALLDGPEVLGDGFDWGHGYASVTHVIGYDAGYYGYLR